MGEKEKGGEGQKWKKESLSGWTRKKKSFNGVNGVNPVTVKINRTIKERVEKREIEIWFWIY